MWPLSRRKDPVPPEDVRLFVNGEWWPVELTYEGQDEDGMHRWVAVPTTPVPEGRLEMKCRLLPARTSVELQVEIP